MTFIFAVRPETPPWWDVAWATWALVIVGFGGTAAAIWTLITIRRQTRAIERQVHEMQNTSIQTDRLSAAIARMAECFARTIIDMQNFGASNSDGSSHSEKSTPGKSDYRTSPVLGLHISGKGVYQACGKNQRIVPVRV